MKLKRLALLLTFLCISVVKTYAQSVPPSVTPASPTETPTVSDIQDADELRTQRELIAELKFIRKDNAALKDEVAALKGEVAVSGRLIKIEQERGDFFKLAAEKGMKIGDNCGLIQERYDRMEATYKAEVARLQETNDKLRNSRNWRAVVGLGTGAGLGYLACSKSK